MLLKSRLKEFFNEDGKPNWERYCESYEKAYPNKNKLEDMNFYKQRVSDNERKRIVFVDFEYAKQGIFQRGKGYSLKFDTNKMVFNKIGNLPCFFSNKDDAEKVGKILRPRYGYSEVIEEIPRIPS